MAFGQRRPDAASLMSAGVRRGIAIILTTAAALLDAGGALLLSPSIVAVRVTLVSAVALLSGMAAYLAHPIVVGEARDSQQRSRTIADEQRPLGGGAKEELATFLLVVVTDCSNERCASHDLPAVELSAVRRTNRFPMCSCTSRTSTDARVTPHSRRGSLGDEQG